MDIYVIHDSTDIVRFENIKKQFDNQILQPRYEIIDAVMDRGKPSKGISKSHKNCIIKAKENSFRWVMIVEDDIKFLNNNSLGLFILNFYKFRDFMNYHEQEWDMLMAGIYEGELSEQLFEQTPYTSGRVVSKNGIGVSKVEGKISGLQCYIINEKFYDTFLKADEEINLDYELSITLKAKIFCLTPFAAIQGIFPSVNGNNMAELNRTLGLKYKLLENGIKNSD